jgi:hypothetical protein
MTSDSVGDPGATGSAGSNDALAEALSIVRGASERGIAVRLVGGLAVRVLCPDLPPRHRDAQDLDFVSVSPARQGLTVFLSEQGYVPDRTYNALYGRKQLFFSHGETGRALDVIIDRLDMCHSLEFKDRIERMPYTLDLPDLLLSKLQIVELNDKDAQDILYLLSTYPIRESEESGAIDLNVFRRTVGEDWGWWRTVTMNLDRIETPQGRAQSSCPGVGPVRRLRAAGAPMACDRRRPQEPALEDAGSGGGPRPLVSDA